ncbi:MAG: hypothetical protein LBT59_30760 [Clostridiales bacterium]|nr:hypothetical protein [Clostridiales bacterium]
MPKERNYTIEFFRFMFAVNFVMLHVYVITPMEMGAFPTFLNGADVIIPFMAFSGYFLMQSYQKKLKSGLTEGISPGRQAWDYLKARLFGLMPLYLLATVMGIVANALTNSIPIALWPMYFINCISEFMGLQITRFGNGNAFSSVYPVSAVANGPLWFISGIFVVGYVIYYLLAKYGKHFTAWIAPVTITLFFSSTYMTDNMPIWTKIMTVGEFAIAPGLIHMFCGMSIGVLLWVACDNLKGKKFSKGMIVFLSVLQFLCVAIVLSKSWISTSSPLGIALNIGWGATFVYTSIFSFLCLLNIDAVTRFPLWASKIWKVPGRLALYIYMLHYPVIYFVFLALGINRENYQANAGKRHLIYAIVLVICIVAGYLIMKFEEKILMPWFKKKPWYTKEQAALELEAK